MRYRLAASDIDDTLLRSDLTISRATRDTILNFQAQGGVFVLSTGRMYPSARKLAEELGLKGYLVSYQGAIVSELASGKILVNKAIDADAAVRLLEELETTGGQLHVYDSEHLYVCERTPETAEYERVCRVQACVLHEKLSDYVRRTRLAAVKILMIHTPETTAKLLGKMREEYGKEFYICTSKPYFLEILQKDVSKAAGVRKVAELYGLTMADVMAVGDSDNDIPMIRAAALGAAVANAAPELKAIADLVTLSNDEDAVAHLIRLNLENKL